ncbi:MAG: RICIN domain-containing protein [Porcipelethomonas sp.]
MKKIKAFLTAVVMLSTMSALYGGAQFVSAEPAVPEGTYMIRNVNSGIYMDVAGGKASNGTNVQQWGAETGQAYNIWRIVPDDNGYFSIYTMLGGGDKYLLSTDSADIGANICIREKTADENQLYELSANADGSFKILTKASGSKNAVEVINAETSGGANIQQWEVNGANCQDWQLIPIKYTDVSALTETQSKIIGDIFTPGDLNDDGKINVFDLIISKRMLISGNGTEHKMHAGNINGDDIFSDDDFAPFRTFLLKGTGTFLKQKVDSEIRYAAIDGEYTNGVTETTNEGFTESAYLNLDNEKNIDVSWNIYAEEDGVFAVTFRYANGGTDNRDMTVTVNSEMVYRTVSFPSTESWAQWSEAVITLPLSKGVNRITAVSLSENGAPNIDYISVTETDSEASPSTPISPIIGVPSSSQGGNYGIYGVGRQMETLDRGVTAAYTGSGMLVSWRTLATDPANTTFKLYKNGEFVADFGADDATNYFVDGAAATDSFTIDTYVNGKMTEFAQTAVILGTKNSGQSGAYMDLPLQKPDAQTMPDDTTCTYTPNDCSVGDVDGDGQYEIIVKWDPSNSQDNSKDGYTGTVFLDCYKLDGTQLWRIDLGKNIRAGAHYTQFQVYDFDGDGKSELMCKTSDGTYDGTGKCIGSPTADYRGSNGRILTGNEYLTLFDGLTGAALDTIDYEPGRGSLTNASDLTYFGDAYGNRCDRFLSGVAYLDGQTPSAVFCRGYYARTAIAAYDVRDKKIVKRWLFDTGNNSSDPYYGQGNHSLVVMDVDGDSKDEIVYGSCCIDDNGKGLWSTGLGHGDCMQAGDLIPERQGLEIFQVHEEHYCAEVHDAATGEIIWQIDGTDDVGRGIALNISADTPGMEFTSVVDSMLYAYNPSTGKIESTGEAWSSITKWGMNSAVWWDGDLEREALDRTMVDKPGRIFTGDGASYNNGSKSNACLTADIFGDWREEMIFPANDGTSLRIFGTTYTTDIKLFTLMHDSQYRTGAAIENVGYNQAPNTSFFLGTGYDLPETPVIYTIPPTE